MRRLIPKAALCAVFILCGRAAALAADKPQGLPSADFSSALVQMLAGLFLVLAVMVGAYWLVRRFLPGPAAVGSGRMRLLGRMGLGARKYLALVEVAGKVLVLGVTNESINLLDTVDDPERVAEMTAAGRQISFAKVFKRAAQKGEDGT